MPATATWHRVGRSGHSLELGNSYANLVRAFNEVLPGEGARPLRRELIIQRHRVMVVQEDEMVANGHFQPGADDQTVFDA